MDDPELVGVLQPVADLDQQRHAFGGRKGAAPGLVRAQRLPFAGKSAQETMIARLRGSPRRLRQIREDLPSKLEATIERCLALEPSERFQTMSELAFAFEATTNTGVIGRLFGR